MPSFARTQDQLAVDLGVCRRTIATWMAQPGFPKKGKRGWSVAKVRAWRESLDADADPLLVDAVDSPALERYRIARARLAELDLKQKRRQALPTDAVVQGLSVFASTMRGAFAELRRQFGEDAYKIVSDGLDDAEMIFERGVVKHTTRTP